MLADTVADAAEGDVVAPVPAGYPAVENGLEIIRRDAARAEPARGLGMSARARPRRDRASG